MKFREMWHAKLLLMLLGCGIFFGACGRSCRITEGDKPYIRVVLSNPVESLDPRFATSASSSQVTALVFASLFEISNDLSVVPYLAEKVETLNDRTFMIRLRKGLSFHDQTPLSAFDVAYTFSSLKNSKLFSYYAPKFDYIDEVKAINDLDVLFLLKRPHASFLLDLSGFGIISKNSQEGSKPNGSGPFKLKHWNKQIDEIHLEPFLDWFEGVPKNEVVFSLVRDENTRLLELIGQKADLCDSEISPQNLIKLKKEKHLKIVELPGLGFTYLAINVRGPRADDRVANEVYKTRKALANKKVRQAIAHAIDFDKIIDRLYLGSADRASGLIPNSHWAKDENLKPLTFAPHLSESLLDEAGFKRDGPKKMRFKVEIASIPSAIRKNAAHIYADSLQKVGIDARVRVKDWTALYREMQQGNFEIVSSHWIPVLDPDLYHWVHHSDSIPKNGISGGNRHGYKNSLVDELIDKARRTLDKEERKKLYGEIEAILLNELPYVALWHERRNIIQNHYRLPNYVASSTGSYAGLRKISAVNKIGLKS